MSTTAPANADRDIDLLRVYPSTGAHGYDEMLDASGMVRPHWRQFLEGLGGVPEIERQALAQRMDRRVRDTGIAYDIFSDPRSTPQRWQLDLAPLVISNAEWRWLRAALTQRARLFDALLSDIYGGQRVMAENLVPPELVFSDPAYLHQCRAVLPYAGGLQFYAADLARGADGLWRVIDNHTETLAGIGYALANRMVHTHVAGELFKACNGVRLAAHFQKMQASLASLTTRDNPRIAVLTPGPRHEDYFSHAYIARYLGYLLVEGADLRTKGNNVYLKTLEGLKEVDLIVRCVEARATDPLELDPSGFDGPAGLMRISRLTPHVVMNPAGAAVAQNRGLGPYLELLCKRLLNETLMLPDAPRLWLGDKAARAHVLKHLDTVVIRSVQEATGRPGHAALGHDAKKLVGAARDAFKKDITLHGARLVAEERIGFSTAPVWGRQGLTAKPFAARFFVSSTAEGYRAMPGGLAMTIDPTRAVALSAPDGHARDIWVIGDAEQAVHESLWRPTVERARVQRSQRVLQSRVADDLFWLGRYCERADWTMRVLRSALRRVDEDSGPQGGLRAARRCLYALINSHNTARVAGLGAPREREIEQMSEQLLAGYGTSRALENTVANLYRVTQLARDRISLEAWQALSKFQPGDAWISALTSSPHGRKLDLIDEGLAALSAFNGLMHENMTRNYGWSFLDMGRRLERAYNLSEAIVALFIPTPAADEETSSLLFLLELADSFITYRSRYRLDPMLALVLDLLLLDETNPRSLAYQLAAISRHLDGLPSTGARHDVLDDRRLIDALSSAIGRVDVEAMAKEPHGRTLEALLEEQMKLLPEFSNALGRHYFNLTDDAPHRVMTRIETKV